MIASGSQIRAARAGLGWSQAELAVRAGIHAQSASYWERQGALSRYRAQGRALGLMLAAFQSAGVDVVSEPRPAVFFNTRMH